MAFHLTVAIACTAPLAWRLDRVALGRESSATVPLFNLWTLRWTADRLPHLFSGWWDAPIFWPTRGSLAFSEPQLLTGMAFAALRPLAGDVRSYSLLLISAVALNGITGAALARRLGAAPAAAILVGVLAQVAPFTFDQFGVLQLTMLWPMLATLAALLAWIDDPQPGRAALVGLGLAACVLTCGYYAVLLALCLAGSGLLLVDRSWREGWTARLGGALVAVGVLAALTGPVVVGQIHLLEGRRWLPQTVRAGSASWTDWSLHGPLWPGAVLLALAAAGAVIGWKRPATRFCLGLVFLAFLASLGSRLSVAGLQPWSVLADHLDSVSRLRSPFRAAAVAQVGLVALSVPAVDRLCRDPRRAVRMLAPVIVVAASMTAGVGPGRLVPAPPPTGASVAWLRAHQDGGAVVWLPFAPGPAVGDFEPTVGAMLASLDSRHPMVNGYSGFFPEGHADLRSALVGFPDLSSISVLEHRATRYALVDADWFERMGRRRVAKTFGLIELARDDHTVLLSIPERSD